MTVTYGFYDSISSDRLYNAKQMGSIFDGLILDGVYSGYGDKLVVIEDDPTSMDVLVGSGRAWFDHTWTYNDAALSKTIPTADATLNRIDIIYLEVNENVGVRANSINILVGTPASSPSPPILTNTSTIHQYALAHVYVGAAVTEIVQANITTMIGTEDTPFVELVIYSEGMQFYRRQGGDPTSWVIPGEVNYIPGVTRMQAGVISWSGSSADNGMEQITFPIAFSQAPLVFVSGVSADGKINCEGQSTPTQLAIYWRTTDGSLKTLLSLNWMAIGPE
jgi:hypothetical protein